MQVKCTGISLYYSNKAETLGHNIDNLFINKSFIHRCRDAVRVYIGRASEIKTTFQSSPPNRTVHCNGKILPNLNFRDSGIDIL